jgi:hypothetical protein
VVKSLPFATKPCHYIVIDVCALSEFCRGHWRNVGCQSLGAFPGKY